MARDILSLISVEINEVNEGFEWLTEKTIRVVVYSVKCTLRRIRILDIRDT